LNYPFLGSKERDSETGLDYSLARYFASLQGRFTKPDAPLLDQNSKNPQSFNLFAYVRNNPLKFSDPTGESCYYYSGALLGCDGDKGLKVDGETLHYIDKKGKARTANLNFIKVQEEIGAGPGTIGDFALSMQLRAPAIKKGVAIVAAPYAIGGMIAGGGAALGWGGIGFGTTVTTLNIGQTVVTVDMAISWGLISSGGRLAQVLRQIQTQYSSINPKSLEQAVEVINRAVEAAGLEPGVQVSATATSKVLLNAGGAVTTVTSSGVITVVNAAGNVVLRLFPK
jgi:RHS repeat-associated protein